MSTARTAVGCLAEDYAADMAEICKAYLAMDLEKKANVEALGYDVYERSDDEQRRVDVASTFVQAYDQS